MSKCLGYYGIQETPLLLIFVSLILFSFSVNNVIFMKSNKPYLFLLPKLIDFLIRKSCWKGPLFFIIIIRTFSFATDFQGFTWFQGLRTRMAQWSFIHFCGSNYWYYCICNLGLSIHKCIHLRILMIDKYIFVYILLLKNLRTLAKFRD